MPVLTEKAFASDLAACRQSIAGVKAMVQNLLIYACYKAFKDGNVTPLNSILIMATESKAVDATRITRWVELHAGIARIVKGEFALNKKVRDESGVTDEETFAKFEDHLRALNWYDIMPRQKAESVWDIDDYLTNVIKTLEKHLTAAGADVALREIKAVKGRLAINAMEAAEQAAQAAAQAPTTPVEG